MSHPQNYVEGDQKYLSSIPRCEHSVYRPSSARGDKPNPACGICSQPKLTDKPVSNKKLKIVDAEIPVEDDLVVVQAQTEEEEQTDSEQEETQPDSDDPQELGVENSNELEEIEEAS